MWCQFDWGLGPLVPFAGGPPRVTLLFCLWLAWSRFEPPRVQPGSTAESVV